MPSGPSDLSNVFETELSFKARKNHTNLKENQLYVWIGSDTCFHFSRSFCMLGQFSSWAIFVVCHCLLTCHLSSQLINRVRQTTLTSSDPWKTKTNPKQTNKQTPSSFFSDFSLRSSLQGKKTHQTISAHHFHGNLLLSPTFFS